MDARDSYVHAVVPSEQAPPIKPSHVAGKATADDSLILHAAIGLAEQIRAASDEIERGRRIPPDIAQAMKDAGVFGMAMPRVWGGPELDPLTQFRVIEALAVADGSAGWCAMIGCDGGYVTAFLDPDVPRDVSRRIGRYRCCCNDDRAGSPGTRGLPHQRAFSVRQRLSAL